MPPTLNQHQKRSLESVGLSTSTSVILFCIIAFLVATPSAMILITCYRERHRLSRNTTPDTNDPKLKRLQLQPDPGKENKPTPPVIATTSSQKRKKTHPSPLRLPPKPQRVLRPRPKSRSREMASRLSRPPLHLPVRLSTLQPRSGTPPKPSTKQARPDSHISPVSTSSSTYSVHKNDSDMFRSPVSVCSPLSPTVEPASPRSTYTVGITYVGPSSKTSQQKSLPRWKDDEWKETRIETVDGVLAPREWV